MLYLHIMLREIEFRVWDTQNERIVYNPYIFERTPDYYLNNSEWEDWRKTDYIFYEFWQDVEDGINRPCIVMQYTNIKDKNGNKIFQGDIIKYTQYYINTNMKYQKVKEVKWNSDRWNIYETNAGEGDIEIIGNIYQNSELIKIKDIKININEKIYNW